MSSSEAAIPGSRIIIEPATWRDLSDLRSLESICFPKDAWPLWDLIGVLTFPNVIRLKAVDKNQMIGFIAADIRKSEKVAWIATVGVLPEYRRQGVGSALLTEIEKRLAVPTVRLSVRSSNLPALLLYSQLGYHRYGIWPRYYTDGEDALVLEKNLNAVGL